MYLQAETHVISPDVFISYQWGKQKEIMALYQRLTSLGFTCWLDIRQMGGGDSLYDKIDRGVRGCKVMLSSVTTKYALSANCRREVSLADALKKPIIPLLMEKIDWPPSGPMSMVLTQLLYVNFSKDGTVQLSWEGKYFDELLHKIRNHIPDNEKTDFLSETNQVKDSKTEILQSNSGNQKQTDQFIEKPSSPKATLVLVQTEKSHTSPPNHEQRKKIQSTQVEEKKIQSTQEEGKKIQSTQEEGKKIQSTQEEEKKSSTCCIL